MPSSGDRKSTRLNSSHLGISYAVFCRSEEHTSELQSLRHLVCRLLLEKKKTHRARCHASSYCSLAQPCQASRAIASAFRSFFFFFIDPPPPESTPFPHPAALPI